MDFGTGVITSHVSALAPALNRVLRSKAESRGPELADRVPPVVATVYSVGCKTFLRNPQPTAQILYGNARRVTQWRHDSSRRRRRGPYFLIICDVCNCNDTT